MKKPSAISVCAFVIFAGFTGLAYAAPSIPVTVENTGSKPVPVVVTNTSTAPIRVTGKISVGTPASYAWRSSLNYFGNTIDYTGLEQLNSFTVEYIQITAHASPGDTVTVTIYPYSLLVDYPLQYILSTVPGSPGLYVLDRQFKILAGQGFLIRVSRVNPGISDPSVGFWYTGYLSGTQE